MMDELLFDNRIAGLIEKFLQEEISEAEHQELQAWVASSSQAKEIFEELTNEEKLPGELRHFVEARKRGLEKIREMEPETRVVVEMGKGFRWRPWLVAAVVVGLTITGYWLLLDNSVEQSMVSSKQSEINDVLPGKEGAILTLTDGTTIILENESDGKIANEGKVTVTKKAGKLVYENSGINKSELVYNKMQTPRGRTYKLELSDSTTVWLNAESSIKYPVFFGNERRVELTGEAYFEVAKSTKKFVVVVDNAIVEVLGTHFNINAYKNESHIKTSLLEGKIKIIYENSRPALMTPGQEANIDLNNKKLLLSESVNVERSISWVRGVFHFDNANLQSVLRQLARWYDVEIEYQGSTGSENFHGEIERNIPLSEVLNNLGRMSHTRFQMENRKIIVSP